MRIAYLIQKWGLRFDKYSDILPIFTQVYDALRNKGVEFPPQIQSQGQGQGSSSAKQEGGSSGQSR